MSREQAMGGASERGWVERRDGMERGEMWLCGGEMKRGGEEKSMVRHAEEHCDEASMFGLPHS